MNYSSPKIIKIGISGKRTIDDKAFVTNEIIKRIKKILKKEKTNSFVGYSSIAIGADDIFASVVQNKFKKELKIVLPFESSEYRKDFIGAIDLQNYEKWINTIGVAEVVTKKIPLNQDERNEAYYEAGKFIVNSCDYMIVVWDELKPKGKGGTSEILGYISQCATIKNLEIITVKPSVIDEINDKIKSLLKTSDKKAVRLKLIYKSIWMTSIILAFLTAICFATTLSFHISLLGKLKFTFFELVCITTVYILIRITRKKLHSNLINERLQAEKLRLLDAYYHADIPITISEVTHKNNKNLAGIGERVNQQIGESYNSVIYKYFTINQLIIGQIDYHNKLINKVIGNKIKILKTINGIINLTWLVILASQLIYLLSSLNNWQIPVLSKYPFPQELVRFFLIALPAAYAAIEAFLHFKDWDNFYKQSSSMLALLKEENNELKKCQLNGDLFPDILNRVSVAMLADNWNWYSIISKKAAPHPIL
jgi:hypothetical protein